MVATSRYCRYSACSYFRTLDTQPEARSGTAAFLYCTNAIAASRARHSPAARAPLSLNTKELPATEAAGSLLSATAGTEITVALPAW